MLVCTSLYWYILVHTSIYSYILTGKSMYWLKQVHTATYQYMQVHTSTYVLIPAHTNSYKLILACACMYWYIPAHTWIQKRCKPSSNPRSLEIARLNRLIAFTSESPLWWIGRPGPMNATPLDWKDDLTRPLGKLGVAWRTVVHVGKEKLGINAIGQSYFSHTFQLHCESTDPKYRVWIMQNFCVSIRYVVFLSVYLALEDELTAPAPLNPVCTGIYRYIPVHTGMYMYVPYTSTYQYILVRTGMYK